MPPKAMSLAYAGRKLTGPPEGYGKKKERQVKEWITDLPPLEEAELVEVASVATLSEVRERQPDPVAFGPAPKPGSRSMLQWVRSLTAANSIPALPARRGRNTLRQQLDMHLLALCSLATKLDGSKEDLYRSLRDSTDGYGPPTAPRVDMRGPGGYPGGQGTAAVSEAASGHRPGWSNRAHRDCHRSTTTGSHAAFAWHRERT